MAGFLDIKSGGKIRYNAPVPSTQTWLRGQFIVVNSAGSLELLSAGNLVSGILGGPALENAVLPSVGNPMNNTNVVLAGNIGSVLLSEAVVVTDNLSGTGGWVPGITSVYAAAGGNYTYTATSGLKCGTALTSPVTNGKLKFLFRPPGSP